MKLFRLWVIVAVILGITTQAMHTVRASGQAAPAAHYQYVIQLYKDNPASLAAVGAGIAPVFNASTNPSLARTYSFTSSAPLASLRGQLAGQYQYLQIDESVTAGDISISAVTNDPGFTSNAQDIDKQWGLPRAGFLQAWNETTGDSDTVVAIIDTGIDGTHDDLSGQKFTAGYNTMTNTPLSARANNDDNGHGTLVAGVIGAVPNNRRGIAGTNWDVTLMPLKALNAAGSGKSSDVSEAIVWAADHDADVINLSLGGLGFGHDTLLANAVSYAYKKNVVIVAAAGNDAAVTGGNLDENPVFPVCDDNGENMIIGVTATDQNDIKPEFANFGKACIDVSAPGRRILSTINRDPGTGAPSPDSYAYASGTSMAVPFVAGEAALLRSLFPSATNRQLRDRIIATAENVDNLNLSQCRSGSCRGLIGAGRIDAAKAVAEQFAPDVDEGDVVQVEGSSDLYYINGGKRHRLSPFVQSQRFATITPRVVSVDDLQLFPEGDYAVPLDGTLVKSANDGTVYYISKGLRLPVTYQVFLLRGLQFSSVNVVTDAEAASWLLGSFLTPPEGTLVRTGKNPTVYWTMGEVLRPISYGFYLARGLNVFPVVYMSDEDVKGFPKGEALVE